ncbi:MAG: hypothetical protein HY721_32390 [Planctomycetes bacterium]|nr:hypothetical protein [Planctomycetota bacterium]
MRATWVVHGTSLGVLVLTTSSLLGLDRQVVQNFDDQADGVPPEGWTIGVQGGGQLGDWQVEAGELSIEGLGAGSGGGGQEVWIWYDRQFSGDVTIEFLVKWIQAPAPAVGRHGGIAFFATFPGVAGSRYAGMSGYTLDWIDRGTDHGVRLIRWDNSAALPECTILPCQLVPDADPPEKWKVEISGDVMTVYIGEEDLLVGEVLDNTYRSGQIGFWHWQNNIHTHFDDLTVTNPDLVVSRDVPDDLVNGTSGTVTLQVLPYLAGNVVVTEDLPAGLTPSNASNGGIITGRKVEWNLGNISEEVTLSYTLAAAEDAIDAELGGSASINGRPFPIAGDTTYTGSPFTPMGFIKLWNHLGPLAWAFPARAGDHGPPGACDANGGAELGLDWIVNDDGSVTEASIAPFPGLVTRPLYGGDGLPGGTGARAAGLAVALGDTGTVTRDQFPVWKAGLSRSDTIDHASAAVHGFDAEDHLTLSCVYVKNNTQGPIDTDIGLGSDDAIQIFVNDLDVTQGGIVVCRGWGAANEEQNTVPVSLPVGESRLLVKVTDGCCQSGFRLRFQDRADPLGPGLLPPAISVRLESETSPPPAKAVRDIAQASYALGEKVGVSIAVTAVAPSDVKVREVLPESASAEGITHGGVLAGGAIEWNLRGITAETVGYMLVPPDCASSPRFGLSTWAIGPVEALVTGETSLARNPLADQDIANWEPIDIGPASGAAVPLGDHEVVVSAAGGGLRSKKEDELRFLHLPVTGDFEVSARIDCLDDPGLAGLAGLMVRDTLDPHAAHVFFGLSAGSLPTGGPRSLVGIYRRQTDPTRLSATYTIAAANKDVDALPIYLKLKRAGTKITAERSADGTQYAEVGSREIGTGAIQVNLRDQTLVGLAVSGGGGGVTGVTFRAVSGPSFLETPPPPAQFHRGDADDNGKLELTDAIRILGFLFLGGVAPICFDAGDADDNGQLQLTDAIRILGFLFLGAAPPASPGPPTEPCGPDAALEDPDILCIEYTSCGA